MATTEQEVVVSKKEYLTKKVKVNGQFVTLYSANGHTWLSSPEEIPEIMARLENNRVTLAEAAPPEAGTAPDKAAAPTAKPAEKPLSPVAPATSIASKYRLKGPKPRPILQQNGMVFKGTPVEPFSASEVSVEVQTKPAVKSGKEVRAKLKAPVRADKVAVLSAKGAPLAKGKKIKEAPVQAAPSVAKGAKGVASKPVPPKKGGAKPVKMVTLKSKPDPRIVKGSHKKSESPKKSATSSAKPKGKAQPAAKKPKVISKRSSK